MNKGSRRKKSDSATKRGGGKGCGTKEKRTVCFVIFFLKFVAVPTATKQREKGIKALVALPLRKKGRHKKS